MEPRKPTETEKEILEAFSGMSDNHPFLRGLRLLLEMIEKREHLAAVQDRLPEGVSREYQVGRDSAILYLRERFEKLYRIANPQPGIPQ